jgi:hypothetical protein
MIKKALPSTVPASDAHSRRSAHREALLEHLFAGEVMRYLWLRCDWRLEVLKPQVDDGGYDLVLEANGITRHVQLKSSFLGSSVRAVPINTLLASKPSGCVVFTRFDAGTLDLSRFAFFGGAPGEPLPSLDGMKAARHTKANALGVKALRANTRTVPLSKFEELENIEALVGRLFGAAGSARA